MPILGEICTQEDLGRRPNLSYAKYVWHACERCGFERWVQLRSRKEATPSSVLCRSCGAKKAHEGRHTPHKNKGKSDYEAGYEAGKQAAVIDFLSRGEGEPQN